MKTPGLTFTSTAAQIRLSAWRRTWSPLLAGCALGMALLMPGLAGGAEMVLATRVTAVAKPWLTPAHRLWLQARGPLTVGISLPDHPPLEMIDGERFQGITADHLGLLFPAPVRFKTYGSRVAVLDALRRGEIDLACEGTELEAERADLALSVPYLPSQPVLVSLSHAPFDAERRGARLAMTSDQLLRSQVAGAYPLSELLTYETPRRALEALSLGEIDGFVGDTVTVHYLIQANYLLNLRVQGFAPIESRGFGMLVRHDDTQLKAYLDQALPAITLQHGDDILHSWSGSRRPLLGSDRVALTPSEKQWLDAHPRIPVVLNSSLGSLGKLNADRQAEGIGPDYLDLISHRSGLQFDYVTARNYNELEAILGSGKALLTPVYTSPPIASPDIKLLPPYLRSAVVVLARPEANAGTQRDKGIHHLQGLEGKRVAMVAGFFLEDTVRREHPRIRLQLYPDLAQALASVAADDSDAFVGNDYAARYANAQQLGNQLQLTGILEDYTRPVSLAVHAAEPELLSILEKAQLSISPEEMAEIVRLWAPRDSGSGTRFWREHRQRLLLLLAALALATATSLVWGFYLSRQMRRTRRAERRAEAANRAKSLFLSTTSHEIRTPLSAIIGLLELAQDREKLGLPHRDTLAAAHKASQGMLLLLGNVLDLHRIESGHIDSTPQPVALRPLIEDMAPLLQGLAHGKRLSLRTQVGKGVDHSVTADPLHLKQVLFNLLSNAIKFTERGSVTLRAQGTRRHDRLLLQMEVEDTGIGIAPQDQARLFKPFSQVPGAHQDQAFGSGLGLSITRRLLEHMGGTITLESVPGRGSRFTVRLSLPLVEPDDRPSAEEVLPRLMPAPLELRAKADTGTEPQPEVPTEPELRILAVEDYMFNRELLKSQLTALGHGISLAGDGQEAWARCLVESFDLIITDGRMPIMDGFEFIRRLRRREAENQLRRCRVIALTASPEASEALRYLQAGADEVLSKPASMEDLRRVIEQVRDELQGSAPGTWHRPPAAPSTLSPA